MEVLFPSESPKNICGEKVKELRLKHGMSHLTLAAKIRSTGVYITWPSVVKIECYTRRVTDIELAAMAKVFNVSVTEFFR